MNKLILIALSLVSASSFAAPVAYTCYPSKKNSDFQNIIKIKVTKSTVTIEEEDENGLNGVAKRNTVYKPQKANEGMIEYGGFDGGDEYQGEILIDESLLTGGEKLSRGGYGGPMKIRARGEGYFYGSFLCVAN